MIVEIPQLIWCRISTKSEILLDHAAPGERPQHVDAAVAAGIADWLVPGRGRGPIARLFSGPRRFHRLCGGRLR